MRELRRRGIALAVVATLAIAVAAYADTFLLDFSGFDWVEGGMLGDVGSCYTSQGFVPAVNPVFLSFDYAINEYTFVIAQTCQVSADTFGTNAVYSYAPTTFDVYCDPIATGTPADFGINPMWPAATASFTDGENVLGGDFSGNLVFVVDLNTWSGNFQGMIDWVRGTQLGNIPVESRVMSLVLAGVSPATPGILPEGYDWQVDGSVFVQDPVARENTSWGKIKSDFRGGN
jgi:hypothetical protein